jgi:CO dehydrogenase/acetyl-CoA synthase beta subunit
VGNEKDMQNMAWEKENRLMILHQASQLRRRVEGYTLLMRWRKHQELVAQSQGQLAKRFPIPSLHTQFVDHLAPEMDEDQVQLEEKDQVIKELQDHLKESQHVIAHIFHDKREMKIKLVERVSDIQTPQDAIGSKKKSALKVPEASKEKESRKSPKTMDLIKPTPPLT